MDLGLAGKVAIVAASSKGLGKASALTLAREGVSVSICSRNASELFETAQQIKRETGQEVLAIPTDVTRPEQIEKLVNETIQHFNKIDILVNNAGGPPPGTFDNFDDQAWMKALELNLFSTIRLTRAVLPSMKQQTSGRIINITSLTVKQPSSELILSNVARAGVAGLSKSLANELAKFNITVNSILPGAHLTMRIETMLTARSKSSGIAYEDLINESAKAVPLGRIGDPGDFGAVVTFLASKQAGFITGESIIVDGGAYKGLM